MANFTANQNRVFANISATPAVFTLKGGLYGVSAKATWDGGSVTLQRLSIDGSTYVTVLTAFTATGYGTVPLPPGTYRLAVTTATAVFAEIVQLAQGV
jgi:hypothetical protein